MRGRASYYSKKNGRLPVLVPDGTGNNMVVLLYKKERGAPGRGAPLFYTRERITLRREPRQQEPPVQEPQQREQQPSQQRAYVNDGS